MKKSRAVLYIIAAALLTAALGALTAGCGGKGASGTSSTMSVSSSSGAVFGITISSDGRYLYVTDQVQYKVYKIDSVSGERLASYTVAASPMYLRLSATGDRLFVSHKSAYMSVITLATGNVQIVPLVSASDNKTVGADGRGMAFSSSQNRLYFADWSAATTVLYVDFNTNPFSANYFATPSLNLVRKVMNVALSSDEKYLYTLGNDCYEFAGTACNFSATRFQAFDTTTLLPAANVPRILFASQTLGQWGDLYKCKTPTWFAMDETTNRTYVSCYGERNTGGGAVMTFEKEATDYELCGFNIFDRKDSGYYDTTYPDKVVLDKDKQYTFTIFNKTNRIAQIDTVSLLLMNFISAGAGPTDIAMSPVERKGFVANVLDGTVTPFTYSSSVSSKQETYYYPVLTAPDAVFTTDRRGGVNLFTMRASGTCPIDVSPPVLPIVKDPYLNVASSTTYFAAGAAESHLDIFELVLNAVGPSYLGGPTTPWKLTTLYTSTSGTNRYPVASVAKVAFVSTQSGKEQIWIMNLTGAGAKSISNPANGSNDTMPTFCKSVTPNKIVFVSDRSGTSELYLTDLEGAAVTKLTGGTTASYRWPSCAPGTNQIVFVGAASDAALDTAADIYTATIDLTTGALTSVTKITAGGANDHPSWSPDGTALLYVSVSGGKKRIYKATNLTQPAPTLTPITSGTFNDSQVRWGN